jgi:hypothetical protein
MQNILKDVYTIMPKLILLLVCFHSQFMFHIFKCNPMLNIYVSKPFQQSKQSPIQARF